MKYVTIFTVLLILMGCNESHQAEKSLPIVHIAIPFVELPPYFIYYENAGIEQDILREAFELAGYQPFFHRTRKREKMFSKPEYNYNCVSTVNEKEKDLKDVAGFFSNEIVSYQDVIITLDSRQLEIKTRADLDNKIIETFKGAKKGLKLEEITKNNPLYHEHSGKASQIVLLYRNRIDALIMEERIFKHFRKKVKNLVNIDQAVKVTSLFDMVPYKLFCTEQKYVGAFNQGLEKLDKSGRYREIFEHYLQ